MTASAAATSPRQALEVGEVVVEGEAAEAGVGQVAVRAGVPGHVALEEGDVVAAGGEGARAARGRWWRGRCPRTR